MVANGGPGFHRLCLLTDHSFVNYIFSMDSIVKCFQYSLHSLSIVPAFLHFTVSLYLLSHNSQHLLSFFMSYCIALYFGDYPIKM